jgi:hypothetical protein
MKGLETIMGRLNKAISNSKALSDTITGYVAWVGKYAESDCVLVEILYQCGAVPFVRTNVSQTLMVRRVAYLVERAPMTTNCVSHSVG